MRQGQNDLTRHAGVLSGFGLFNSIPQQCDGYKWFQEHQTGATMKEEATPLRF